jgi:pimeloyl-ACP methyl ester carboxylesterase
MVAATPQEQRRSMTAAFLESTDGVRVAVHQLAADDGGPHLLVAHATGFHGRCYQPVADALTDRSTVIAFDFRGHGDTALHDIGDIVDWRGYGDDAEAVAVAVSAGRALSGFGHSMGGAALLMAAHRNPTLFTGLVLFEPIVFPPTTPIASSAMTSSPMVDGALRRRRTFQSYEQAIANYAAKPPMNAFTPAALDAYVRFGFAATDDGVTLKCTPEHEAATFRGGSAHRVWELLGDIVTPVVVVAGRVEPGRPSDLARQIAERLPRGRYVELADVDHFGPMTHPGVVAKLIESAQRPS